MDIKTKMNARFQGSARAACFLNVASKADVGEGASMYFQKAGGDVIASADKVFYRDPSYCRNQ